MSMQGCIQICQIQTKLPKPTSISDVQLHHCVMLKHVSAGDPEKKTTLIQPNLPSRNTNQGTVNFFMNGSNVKLNQPSLRVLD